MPNEKGKKKCYLDKSILPNIKELHKRIQSHPNIKKNSWSSVNFQTCNLLRSIPVLLDTNSIWRHIPTLWVKSKSSFRFVFYKIICLIWGLFLDILYLTGPFQSLHQINLNYLRGVDNLESVRTASGPTTNDVCGFCTLGSSTNFQQHVMTYCVSSIMWGI